MRASSLPGLFARRLPDLMTKDPGQQALKADIDIKCSPVESGTTWTQLHRGNILRSSSVKFLDQDTWNETRRAIFQDNPEPTHFLFVPNRLGLRFVLYSLPPASRCFGKLPGQFVLLIFPFAKLYFSHVYGSMRPKVPLDVPQRS
jgi:hypothetical protein